MCSLQRKDQQFGSILAWPGLQTRWVAVWYRTRRGTGIRVTKHQNFTNQTCLGSPIFTERKRLTYMRLLHSALRYAARNFVFTMSCSSPGDVGFLRRSPAPRHQVRLPAHRSYPERAAYSSPVCSQMRREGYARILVEGIPAVPSSSGKGTADDEAGSERVG